MKKDMKKQEDVKPKKVSKPRKKKEVVKVVVEDAPKKEPKKVSKPKTKRKKSAWNVHVSQFYQEKKKADSTYQYKNALKDAKATYTKKKQSSN